MLALIDLILNINLAQDLDTNSVTNQTIEGYPLIASLLIYMVQKPQYNIICTVNGLLNNNSPYFANNSTAMKKYVVLTTFP